MFHVTHPNNIREYPRVPESNPGTSPGVSSWGARSGRPERCYTDPGVSWANLIRAGRELLRRNDGSLPGIPQRSRSSRVGGRPLSADPFRERSESGRRAGQGRDHDEVPVQERSIR